MGLLFTPGPPFKLDSDLAAALKSATRPCGLGEVMMISNPERAIITGMFILEQVRRNALNGTHPPLQPSFREA